MHRGHLIWWQSSQYRSCSGGYSEKFDRGARGSNVCSSSSSSSDITGCGRGFTGLALCGDSLDLRFLEGSGTEASAHGQEMNV
jgi:hypothetical protein